MPAAKWTDTAQDLSGDLVAAGRHLNLDEVCERTHLARATVEDSLLRPVINDPTNPKGAICRPAARIGGRLNPIPLWLPAQCVEYKRRVNARKRHQKLRNKERAQLRMLTAEQAAAHGLASLKEIAVGMPAPPGGTPERAENTLRRYARDYRTTFPPEVAIATPSQGGPPLGYRERDAVVGWVLDHERGHGEPDQPLAG